MGEVYHVLIPRDPQFLPNEPDAVLQVVVRMYPAAENITLDISAGAELRDCGAHLEAIRCPSCHADIAIEDWQELMSGDYDEPRNCFRLTPVTVSCCGHRSPLNELIYVAPMGFSRCAISILSPGREALGVEELAQLSLVVGSPVMLIDRLL